METQEIARHLAGFVTHEADPFVIGAEVNRVAPDLPFLTKTPRPVTETYMQDVVTEKRRPVQHERSLLTQQPDGSFKPIKQTFTIDEPVYQVLMVDGKQVKRAVTHTVQVQKTRQVNGPEEWYVARDTVLAWCVSVLETGKEIVREVRIESPPAPKVGPVPKDIEDLFDPSMSPDEQHSLLINRYSNAKNAEELAAGHDEDERKRQALKADRYSTAIKFNRQRMAEYVG